MAMAELRRDIAVEAVDNPDQAIQQCRPSWIDKYGYWDVLLFGPPILAGRILAHLMHSAQSVVKSNYARITRGRNYPTWTREKNCWENFKKY